MLKLGNDFHQNIPRGVIGLEATQSRKHMIGASFDYPSYYETFVGQGKFPCQTRILDGQKPIVTGKCTLFAWTTNALRIPILTGSVISIVG